MGNSICAWVEGIAGCVQLDVSDGHEVWITTRNP